MKKGRYIIFGNPGPPRPNWIAEMYLNQVHAKEVPAPANWQREITVSDHAVASQGFAMPCATAKAAK